MQSKSVVVLLLFFPNKGAFFFLIRGLFLQSTGISIEDISETKRRRCNDDDVLMRMAAWRQVQ